MEDFLLLDSLFSPEEKLAQKTIKKFVDAEVLPVIGQAFEAGNFPLDFIERLAELRVLGMSLPTSHGGLGIKACAYGLVCQELERGDSGLRSFVSVPNALVIFPIFTFGEELQHKNYLPKLISGEMIGCFGLTEPGSGSDPSSMTTYAEKVSGGYRLSGTKAWITNAPIADIAIVWAKTKEGIRGFIVERDFNGFAVHETKHKLSMRASSTGELVFDECFVPDANILPKSDKGLLAALQCLSEARFGIAWGATGAARQCYAIALDYAVKRTQFNKPIASCQLVQKDLVRMVESISKSQLLNVHVARLKEQGLAHFSMISLAKMSNTREALEVARLARNVLGANGISLEYQVIRHMVNLETLFTYEGTDNIHQLIVGKHITGLDAF